MMEEVSTKWLANITWEKAVKDPKMQLNDALIESYAGRSS